MIDSELEMERMQAMKAVVSTLISLISMADFDVYLSKIGTAHAALPIIDPTGYMKADLEASRAYENLIREFKEIQNMIIKEKERVQKEEEKRLKS